MATLTAAEASTVLTMKRDLFRASAANPALIALEQHLLLMMVRRIANTDTLIADAWRQADGGRRSVRDGLVSFFGGTR
jgi:hypothetical protein